MKSYTVFSSLEGRAKAIRGITSFDGDIALTHWARNETARTIYAEPNHHTVSFYLSGGREIKRRCGKRLISGGEPGVISVMPAGEDADWDVSGPIEMLHLYFTDSDIAALVQGDWKGPVRPKGMTFAKNPTIEAIMRALLLRLDWDAPADRLAISHAALSVIALLLKDDAGASTQAWSTGGLTPRSLARVKDYIEAHLADPLRVDELSAIAGLSPFHFSRVFRETVAETPHAYVTRLRIEHAARLIKENRLPLAQISASAGFSSQSHLARRFRELMGVSPAVYAALHKD